MRENKSGEPLCHETKHNSLRNSGNGSRCQLSNRLVKRVPIKGNPAHVHRRQLKGKIPFSPQRLRGTEFKKIVIPYKFKNSVSQCLCGEDSIFFVFS